MIRSLLLSALSLVLVTGTLFADDGEDKVRSGEMVFRDPVVWFKMDDREEQLGGANDENGTFAKHGLSVANYQQNTTEGESGTKDISTITLVGAQGFTITMKNKDHIPVTRTVTYSNGKPHYTWALAPAQQ